MSNPNPLRIMAKPLGQPRNLMAKLPWLRPGRPHDALHWTVIPDPSDDRWKPAVIAAVLVGLDASPFRLVFDQACGRVGGTAEIHCRHVPREARKLVAALRQAFKAIGIPFSRGTRPHVTLDYRWDGPNFEEAIAPIVWDVDRLMIMETLAETGRHKPHGTWSLVPRQGTLFPLQPCDGDRSGTPARFPG